MSLQERMAGWFTRETPLWGLILGVLLAIGDILLTPPDQGEAISYVGASRLSMLLAILALCLAWTATTWLDATGRKRVLIPSVAVGVVFVGIIIYGAGRSDIYGSDAVPAWRFVLLPVIAAIILASGASLLRRDADMAQRLMITGLIGICLVGYAQEAALVWALVAALAVSYGWLAVRFGKFSARTGLVMHALAVLALVQSAPGWFAWTPFPFLTLFPIYVLGLYLLHGGCIRRDAWWVGVVVAGGTTLLGFSTLIGNIRRSLPVWESVVMLAGGSVFVMAFLLLRFMGTAQPQPEAA